MSTELWQDAKVRQQHHTLIHLEHLHDLLLALDDRVC
jgi:hypothetical protein